MIVEHLNLILGIYLLIGCIMASLFTAVPKRPHRHYAQRIALFLLIVMAWLPLGILSWILLPFIRACSCLTRH